MFLRFLTNDVPEQADAAERALAAAHMDGLTLPDSDLITEALLEYAESSVDFIDAYNAAWIRNRGLRRIATFDQKHYPQPYT